MFKYWKEMRELKTERAKYVNFLLLNVCEVVLEYKKSQKQADESEISTEEAIDIINKLKGLGGKDLASALVKNIKPDEKAE